METTIEKNRKKYVDRYDLELDNKSFPPSGKLEKAKAYFQEHGFPDLDKIMREAEEKKANP